MNAVVEQIQTACTVPDEPWPQPARLESVASCQPYPIDALPDILRCAVQEVQSYVQSPVAMVASSALAAVAAASQAHFDVARDASLIGPTSLNLLVLGDSGERKTSSDRYFNRPILKYEAESRTRLAPELKRYEANRKAYDERVKGLGDAIRKQTRDGNDAQAERQKLAALELDAVDPPRVPELVLMDATPEGLTHSLATKWPSGVIASSEGGLIFGGQAMGRESIMRNLAILNSLWDGEQIKITRRSSEPLVARGVRLSVALQVQPTTLADFLDKNGGLARGIGYLARFLVARPDSTQGTRMYREPPTGWPALTAFESRIEKILRWEVALTGAGTLKPSTLSLSKDARQEWIKWHDAVERRLAAGGDLSSMQDVASKAADNLARVAALFDIVTAIDRPKRVSAESVVRAGRLVDWHFMEAQRVFGEMAASVEQRAAQQLDEWLIERCHKEKVTEVTRRDAHRAGPRSTRCGNRLDQALSLLEEADRVRCVETTNNRRLIQVSPHLLTESDDRA